MHPFPLDLWLAWCPACAHKIKKISRTMKRSKLYMSNFYIFEDLQLILSCIICLKEMRGLPPLCLQGHPTTVLKWVVDFVR
jgi:hypothetical protein